MAIKTFAVNEVLTAADTNTYLANSGLVLITSGITVTSAGGTAATVSNGTVTIGSGNTSVTISNAFSSNYDNYRILISGGSASTVVDLQCQLGSTVTGYYGFLTYGAYNSNTVQGFGVNNGSSFPYAGAGSTDGLSAIFDIRAPFASQRTFFNAQAATPLATTGAASAFSGFLNDNTSYTAFTIKPNGGTISSGIIRIYGYRQA